MPIILTTMLTEWINKLQSFIQQNTAMIQLCAESHNRNPWERQGMRSAGWRHTHGSGAPSKFQVHDVQSKAVFVFKETGMIN